MRVSRRSWMGYHAAFAAAWMSAGLTRPAHSQADCLRRLSCLRDSLSLEIAPTSPGIAELDAMCVDLARRGVPVEVIGYSRGGRPIRRISPAANGPLQALVVGTPHPNEPIGGRTIQVMVDLLLRKSPSLAQLPFTWHFIPSIEPDGLALNDGWLQTPHDLGAYMKGFYRPAFRHQAEYAFPLRAPAYRFDAVTPETQAWMSTIDQLQPALMVSLHNADLGGAFSVVSHPHLELAAELSRRTSDHGIALDEAGDPYGEQQVLAPGVFLADDFPALVGQAPGAWTAGNSSTGYASRHGTLGIVPEVPLWQEAAAGGLRPSSDVWSGLAETYEATASLVERAQALIHAGEPDLLLDAVVESVWILRRLAAKQPPSQSKLVPATLVNLTRRRLRMQPLRTLGMLSRLCGARAADSSDSARRRALTQLEQESAALMDRQLGDKTLTSGMVPVPLPAAVATQLQAVVVAATVVAADPAAAKRLGPRAS